MSIYSSESFLCDGIKLENMEEKEVDFLGKRGIKIYWVKIFV